MFLKKAKYVFTNLYVWLQTIVKYKRKEEDKWYMSID